MRFVDLSPNFINLLAANGLNPLEGSAAAHIARLGFHYEKTGRKQSYP
jgi:hypothetical protein